MRRELVRDKIGELRAFLGLTRSRLIARQPAGPTCICALQVSRLDSHTLHSGFEKRIESSYCDFAGGFSRIWLLSLERSDNQAGHDSMTILFCRCIISTG